jgi:GNAT superfamily N-acetyltransferase
VIGMGYLARRVEEQEWKQLREIRLAALADTPIGFGMWHADALNLPDEHWQETAERAANAEETALFVALDDETGEWVGLAGGFTPDQYSDYWDPRRAVIAVYSVFVAPEHRGRARGVADLLFDTVIGWAGRDWPDSHIVLGVHDRNERAHAFYRRYGFVDNGRSIPYILDDTAAVLLMDYRPAGR